MDGYKKGFRICQGKGFHIVFDNGWGLSVQIGTGNYCENRSSQLSADWQADQLAAGDHGSIDAEIAVMQPDGELYQMEGCNDTVKGWVDAAEVLKVLNWVAKQ